MTRLVRAPLMLVAAAALLIPRGARAQDAPPPPPAEPAPPPADAPPPQAYPPPPQAYPPPPPGYAQPGYPPPGYAQPGYPPPGYIPAPTGPAHEGIFVRLTAGFGYLSVSENDGYGGTIKFSGPSGSFSFAVGGGLTPSLALFGNVFASVASQPDAMQNGIDYGKGTGQSSVGLAGFGAGVVYYIMPVNVYLSGTFAATKMNVDDVNGNNAYESDYGLGFQGIVGKEWWVSQHWGLGVAGEFVGASMKDKNTSSVTWTGGAFNILFSATCF